LEVQDSEQDNDTGFWILDFKTASSQYQASSIVFINEPAHKLKFLSFKINIQTLSVIQYLYIV